MNQPFLEGELVLEPSANMMITNNQCLSWFLEEYVVSDEKLSDVFIIILFIELWVVFNISNFTIIYE